MTQRAFLGMSHSPLMGFNAVSPLVEQALKEALSTTRELVLQFDPEVVVLVAPDHYNGFFNELMPPFCIGTQAHAVGDHSSPKGALNVNGELSEALAAHLMDEGFDLAISRRMQVDHGFSQSLQLLWGGLDTPPVIPIFMNAVAQPGIPRLKRCRALGQAIGRFLDGSPKRALLLGSGGLSHEPPVPTMSNPDPAERERIIVKREPTQAEREASTKRVIAAGLAFARGDSTIKPINPEWDRRWMDLLARGTGSLDNLCAMTEESIGRDAGLSAHESKTWLVARSALSTESALSCPLKHYQAIPEYIAGFGLMFLREPVFE